MLELVDNYTTALLNMTIEELDYLSEHCSADEMEEFTDYMSKNSSFSQKRRILQIRNKYILLYNQSL